MDAYLLCAGFGTRMQPLTDETPKSLLPVGGRPLLDHLVGLLDESRALDTLHLVANHRDVDAFRAWAAARGSPRDGVSIQVYDDGVSGPDEQLGAIGDLQFLLEKTDPPSDGALVSGGDSLYRFPLAPLLAAFDSQAPQVLALHQPDPAQRRQSSVLRLEGSRVLGLAGNDETASTRICPSWYLLPPSALSAVGPYLDGGGDPDTLGTFIDALAQRRRVDAVRLPKRPDLRLHCNTPDDLQRARTLLDQEPSRLLDAETVRRCVPNRAL